MSRRRDPGWVRVPTEPFIAAQYPGTRTWQRDTGDGHLTVIVNRDPAPEFSRPRWHLSISHRTNTHPPVADRYPDWDEITDARYRFIPDEIQVVMGLPPRAEYVNVHTTTFHLWELDGRL